MPTSLGSIPNLPPSLSPKSHNNALDAPACDLSRASSTLSSHTFGCRISKPPAAHPSQRDGQRIKHSRNQTEGCLDRPQLPPLITKARPLPTLDSAGPAFSLSPAKESNFAWSSRNSAEASPIVEGVKSEEKGGIFDNWFKGGSEPLSIGILPAISPTKELADPMMANVNKSRISIAEGATFPSRPTARLQKTFSSATTSTSRFSFFGSKSTPEKKTQELPELADDEFLNLDINEALFPNGSADPFSPAVFKNLLMNAEGLLLRLQTAYKLRTISLHEMTAEKKSQFEDLEEADTRSQHLKTQLGDMAAKVDAQEATIAALREELAEERKIRKKEEDIRKRSIKIVSPPTSDKDVADDSDDEVSSPRPKKRISQATFDSGFESGDESYADSVFSHQLGTESPAITLPSGCVSPVAGHLRLPLTSAPTISERVELQRQPSAFQKMFGGPTNKSASAKKPVPDAVDCRNCHGVPSSEAWSVLGVLKEENKALKGRMEDLEGAVDTCLDLVGGLHLDR